MNEGTQGEIFIQEGDQFYEQGKYEEACLAYQNASNVTFDNAQVYHKWGKTLAQLEKYQDAIEKYRYATALNPSFKQAFDELGEILERIKESPEPIKQYSIPAEAYFENGDHLAQNKQYDKAIENYRKAIEINPKFKEAYNSLGITLGDIKRYEESFETFRLAIKIDNTFDSPYYNIAYNYWEQGMYQEAWDAWEDALHLFEQKLENQKLDEAQDFLFFGYIYSNLGDLAKAEEIYKKGLEMDPKNTDILFSLVELYLERRDEPETEVTRKNKKAEANSKLQEYYFKGISILKNHSEINIDTLQSLGNFYLKMEQYEDAEECFLKGLKLDSLNHNLMASLGVLYARKEDFIRGIQYFRAKLRSDPDNFSARSNLAEVYLKAGMIEKAESEYKKILKVAPGHIESNIGLGEVYTSMGDKENDIDYYKDASINYMKALNFAATRNGSRRLKKSEMANLFYSSGYVNFKIYETSKFDKDEKQLEKALNDFKICVKFDEDHFKGKRVIEKIEKWRPKLFSNQGLLKIGGEIIMLFSCCSFIVGLGSFLGKSFTKLNPEISDFTILTLTFGSLIFFIAGLFLPQIMKLKFAGIELEKSSIDQITTTGLIRISR